MTDERAEIARAACALDETLAAPERIWAQPEHSDEPDYGGFWIRAKVAPSVEYVRSDLAHPSQDMAGDERVRRLVTVARRQVESMCEGFCKNLPSAGFFTEDMEHDCAVCRMRAALSAMDTPKGGGDGWQSIETAPKDGTSILTFPNYHVTHYEADPAECITGPGWVASWDDGFEAYITMRNEPTHWQPLPPAPPAAMKDGG